MFVFISYSSYDRDTAFSVCAHLEKAGIPCWIAPRNIGVEGYAGAITRAIHSCDATIVICSESANHSQHLKSEVNIAFSANKLIIPYCIGDVVFCDDLEYYLASKQCIKATNDFNEDLRLLERLILQSLGKATDQVKPTPKLHSEKKASKWIPLSLLSLAIIVAGFLLWSLYPPTHPTKSLQPSAPHTGHPEAPISASIPDTVITQDPVNIYEKTDSQHITFSGQVNDGYPDGIGRLTFKSERRIDLHDTRERMAVAGDYIEGEWKSGHLIQGKWYDSHGNDKGFILLGQAQNPELDHKLGKCER